MHDLGKITYHAHRTWYDEASSKGAKNHWDPFYGANPINLLAEAVEPLRIARA